MQEDGKGGKDGKVSHFSSRLSFWSKLACPMTRPFPPFPPFPSFPLALRWMFPAQAFAGMNVCTRLGARDLPWAEVGAARFLVGALMAGALGFYQGTSLRITDRPSTWRRSVFGALSAVCTFYALGSSRIALGDVATLGATAPIFVAVLSGPLLGERVGGRVTLAIALVFAGNSWGGGPVLRHCRAGGSHRDRGRHPLRAGPHLAAEDRSGRNA